MGSSWWGPYGHLLNAQLLKLGLLCITLVAVLHGGTFWVFWEGGSTKHYQLYKRLQTKGLIQMIDIKNYILTYRRYHFHVYNSGLGDDASISHMGKPPSPRKSSCVTGGRLPLMIVSNIISHQNGRNQSLQGSLGDDVMHANTLCNVHPAGDTQVTPWSTTSQSIHRMH